MGTTSAPRPSPVANRSFLQCFGASVISISYSYRCVSSMLLNSSTVESLVVGRDAAAHRSGRSRRSSTGQASVSPLNVTCQHHRSHNRTGAQNLKPQPQRNNRPPIDLENGSLKSETQPLKLKHLIIAFCSQQHFLTRFNPTESAFPSCFTASEIVYKKALFLPAVFFSSCEVGGQRLEEEFRICSSDTFVKPPPAPIVDHKTRLLAIAFMV